MKWLHTFARRRGVPTGFTLVMIGAGSLAWAAGVENSASNEAELKTAAKRADLCSAANAVGIGLKGEYFTREGLEGEPLTSRIDKVVDFDSQFDLPADKAMKVKSVKWSGWFKVPVAGAYQFHCNVPGMRVTVAGRQMCGEGAPVGASSEFAVGRYYPVGIEIRRLQPWPQSQRARFEWTTPHGARFVVPRPLLNPPSDTVAKSPK